MNDDDNISKLPVRFKEPRPERTLVRPHEVGRPDPCNHLFVQYIVSEASCQVECGQCGTKLNPMWVLSRLATEDRRYAEARQNYQDELKRLGERSRTKCDHCGQMTNISRR